MYRVSQLLCRSGQMIKTVLAPHRLPPYGTQVGSMMTLLPTSVQVWWIALLVWPMVPVVVTLPLRTRPVMGMVC